MVIHPLEGNQDLGQRGLGLHAERHQGATHPLNFLLVILEIVPQRVESLATHLYDNAMRYAGAPESGRLSCHNQFGENNEP